VVVHQAKLAQEQRAAAPDGADRDSCSSRYAGASFARPGRQSLIGDSCARKIGDFNACREPCRSRARNPCRQRRARAGSDARRACAWRSGRDGDTGARGRFACRSCCSREIGNSRACQAGGQRELSR
jgi:hypothetical protein